MKLLQPVCALVLGLALAACSGSEPKDLIQEGQQALNSGDSAGALAKFESAAKELKAEDPLYLDAKLGMVVARIDREPAVAAKEFLELAHAQPAKVTEKEFLYVSGQMVSARKYSEAIDLVHEGIKRSGGESPELLARIQTIQKEAANDSGVMSKLKGLGYVE